ncbi:MAG TPA: hypothetical protein PKC45_09720 [Gemmatales bacterium]|nr:hypothetical protein [Gemmatales bacterium]
MRRPMKKGRAGQESSQSLPPKTREELEGEFGVGNVLDTRELAREYVVIGHSAPLLVVTRKSDGSTGTLQYQNDPRYYFGWKPDQPP